MSGTKPKRLTEDEREQIIELRLLGTPVRTVAAQVGVAKGTVLAVFAKHLAEVRERFMDQAEDARADVVRRLEGIADRARSAYAKAEDRDKPRFLAEERQALSQLAKIAGLEAATKVEHSGDAIGGVTIIRVSEDVDRTEVERPR
jgi:hypothetical protein